MLAVGDYVLGGVDEKSVRMTTGFSGGVGRQQRDFCGALSAGIMVIGARHGRASLKDDEIVCQQMTNSFRDLFSERLGSVYCYQLRREKYGSHGEEPCSVLVERTAGILLEVLNNESCAALRAD
jgi:C_GCAxxG_C_C family probable redox protein